MDKQELFDYLRDNLSIEVDRSYSSKDVMLRLKLIDPSGEEITISQDYIDID